MPTKELKFSDFASDPHEFTLDDDNIHVTTVQTPDVSPNDVLKLVLDVLPEHSYCAFSSPSGEGKQASVTFLSDTLYGR